MINRPISEVLKDFERYQKTGVVEIIQKLTDELWYDWFCKDEKLVGKTIKLLKKLKIVSKSKLFDIDKCYVFFRNNSPLYGNRYDDFRIWTIETPEKESELVFCITPKSGFTIDKGKGKLYGSGYDLLASWKEIKAILLEQNGGLNELLVL